MRALTPHPLDSAALSACLMAGRLASHRLCLPISSTISFRGFPLTPLLSIALQHGRCWLRLPYYGSSLACSLLATPPAPLHVFFRTDNSPSQSAAWKGLTLARGMCQLFLRQFCLLQKTVRISVHLDSVPGFLNDTADALSRAVPPSTLGFQPHEALSFPWTSFPEVPALAYFPLQSLMEPYVAPSV